MSIRLDQLQPAYENLSATARKVYDAVPINEAWTAFRIGSELKRIGTPKERHIVEGCLASLMRDGLVKEYAMGTWTRTPIRAMTLAEINEEPPVSMKTEAPTPAPKQLLIERIGSLASRARALASQLNTLADDIDSAAVGVDEELAGLGKEHAALNQLRNLLKSL